MNKIIDSIIEQSCNNDVRKKPEYLARISALKRYRRKNQPVSYENPDLTGFYFDLSLMNDFFKKINDYNKIRKETEKQIGGIRIWKTKSLATTDNNYLDEKSEKPNENQTAQMDDLMIIPTWKGSKSDIYSSDFVDSETLQVGEKLLIIGNGQPCPNLCPGENPSFFFQHPDYSIEEKIIKK